MFIPAGGRPEDRARANIDRLLTAAGWLIQNGDSIDIEAGRGVAIREFPLAPGLAATPIIAEERDLLDPEKVRSTGTGR
jgi:hypothetical protein